MNWGSLISSVLPTIGTVVGSLLGVNKIEDGVVHFGHENVLGAEPGFSSQFYVENGKYFLFNQSTSKDDIVTMTFPARGQTGAETVMVPGRQSFDVTPFFEDNAKHDSTGFELTACSSSQSANAQSGEQAGIKISASGQGIPVGGQKQSIGAYMDVQVQQNQVTIYPKNGMQLQSLPMLQIQASGDTGVRVIDVKSQTPQAVQIVLPQPLQENDRVSVEVVANIQPQSTTLLHLVQTQKHANLLSDVDDDTARRLESAPRLNWR